MARREWEKWSSENPTTAFTRPPEARAEFVYAPMCAPRAERDAPTTVQSTRDVPWSEEGGIRLQYPRGVTIPDAPREHHNHWVLTFVCADRPGHRARHQRRDRRGARQHHREPAVLERRHRAASSCACRSSRPATAPSSRRPSRPVTDTYGDDLAARRRRPPAAHPRARLDGRALRQRPAVPPARRPAAASRSRSCSPTTAASATSPRSTACRSSRIR